MSQEIPLPQKMLAYFVFESDKIDGIGGDRGHFQDICRQIDSDVETGHVGALLMLERKVATIVNVYVDEELIKKIEELITAEQCSELKGDNLKETSFLLAGLIKSINWWQQNARCLPAESTNLEYLARFHHQFLKIYPYSGRTARALNYFLMRSGAMNPFIFTNGDRARTYLPAIANSNPDLMFEYFKLKNDMTWTFAFLLNLIS